MRVRFKGFPEGTWKVDEPATVLGYGIVPRGETILVDEDTAKWLLSNKAEWEMAPLFTPDVSESATPTTPTLEAVSD